MCLFQCKAGNSNKNSFYNQFMRQFNKNILLLIYLFVEIQFSLIIYYQYYPHNISLNSMQNILPLSNQQTIINPTQQQHKLIQSNLQNLPIQQVNTSHTNLDQINNKTEEIQIQQKNQQISNKDDNLNSILVESIEIKQQMTSKCIESNFLKQSTLLLEQNSFTDINHMASSQVQPSNILQAQSQKNIQQNPAINLMQSTPFSILQQSTSNFDHSQQLLSTQGLFTQAYTQEINIEQSVFKKQMQTSQQIICQTSQSNNNIHVQNSNMPEKKCKFSISRTLQINLFPQIKAQTKVQAQKQKPKQEIVKPQPLKIENLFISSLRSKSQIKPPQSTIEKKPKPWQKFKSKKSVNDIPPVQAQVKKQSSLINPLPSEQCAIKTESPQPNNENIKEIPKIEVQDQINTNQTNLEAKTQVKSNALPNEVKIQQKQPFFQNFKAEEKIIQPKPSQQKQAHQIQFHQAKHHPLQHSQPIKIPPQVKNGQKQQENQIIKQPEAQIPVQQVNQIPQNLPQENIKEEQQSVSSSQKQQIQINYNLKKKSQEQQQRLKRQKIKQLQQDIKRLTEINKQLQKSVSLPIKVLISAVVGLGTGGIVWALKKDKLRSIIVGFASSMAALVLSS